MGTVKKLYQDQLVGGSGSAGQEVYPVTSTLGVYDTDNNQLQGVLDKVTTNLGLFTCGTAAATAAKTVSASKFVLMEGGSVKIKFTYANSADSPTLAIGSTAAKPIMFNGSAASASNSWGAGEIVEFFYDGTNWVGNITSISVSQNSQTGHTDITIGDTTTPVASVEDVDKIDLKLEGGKEYQIPSSQKNISVDNSYGTIQYVAPYLKFHCNANAESGTVVNIEQGGVSGISIGISLEEGFWNSDDTLLIDLICNTNAHCLFDIGFRKDGSNYELGIDVSSLSESKTIDVKELFKTTYETSYNQIDMVWVYGLRNTDVPSLVQNVSLIGFYSIKEAEYQKKLKSGENIKTINGESILGRGNLTTDITINDDTLYLRNIMPDYYTKQPVNPTSFDDDSYIDVKINSVPMVKKGYIYFTDTHWEYNAKRSPYLIQYVRQRLGIKKVIFGGDFIDMGTDKYIAKQVFGDFAYHCLSAFGNDMLAVMGNHDNNLGWFNESDPDIPLAEARLLPSKQVYDCLFRYCQKNSTFWDDNKTTLLAIANNASYTDAQIQELEAECKLTYYYDDVKNHIRYIILNSTKPGFDDMPMNDLFGSSGDLIYAYMVWYYNVLLSTPSNYDVCICLHMLSGPNATGNPVNSISLAIICSLPMGLKTKTIKDVYVPVSDFNENLKILYPYTGTHSWDFSGANNIGKIFFHVGHSHEDGISVITPNDAYGKININPYNGISTIDQTINDTSHGNGCPIPVIWTTCDAYGLSAPPRQDDSVNEQAFDVVTIDENKIKLIRFGGGMDRLIMISS